MKLFVLEWNRSARGEDGAAAPTLFAASGALIAHDGPLHVVGDIQLHAREELRRRLASAGVSADAGTGDGSLILAAWRAWGPTCVDRIIGDFAFALWDDGRREVFCARDQLGVRPLYYADVRGAFVCSNAIAAIRQHAQVSSQVHTPAIVSFLECGWNTDLGTTTFSDIRRLPPGHTMNVRTDAAPAPHRYWQFPVPEPLVYSSDTDYIEHYRQVLSDAGRDRTGDGPVGLMLSGGLDSTSLAATLRRTAPAQLVTAYTTDVGAIVPNDDVRLARLVASRLGMPHDVSADIPQALEHLTDSTFHPPEPLDEPEYAAWRRLMARVAKHERAMIFGEDGDALFAPPSLLRTLRRWPAGAVLGRVMRQWLSSGRRPHLGVNWRARLAAVRAPRWKPVPWLRDAFTEVAAAVREPDHGTHPYRPEVQRFLLGTIWQSVHEVFSPAYSGADVEMRWPLLDLRVLEFALAIPPIPWCQHKELTRRAFRDELPVEVLGRPKTTLGGYGTAKVKQWRHATAARTPPFMDRTLEYIDTSRVTAALADGAPDDIFAAWRVLALDSWLRELERTSA